MAAAACGSPRTDEEVNWLKYVYGISRLAGYECEIIGPSEIKQYHPYLETFGIKAAFRTVNDGHVAPADITNAMAAGARQLGAEIVRRNRVMDIKLLPNGEWRVFTEQGTIDCEHVVNSAGSYCDVVGSWTGHNVPIANMLHHYVITEPLKELIDLDMELPVVRDPYSHAYLREETNGVLVGPYETATAHLCWDGQPPRWDYESELEAPELDRIMPWLEKATERLPLFGQTGVKSIISGAITHTPDGVYLSGPAHGPKNYWMHCGASIGICQGGGAGKYLAQWMVHGQAEINMREFDPRRFGNWATKDYTAEVSVADYHHMYYCYKPAEQHEVGRGLRKSSLYDKLKAEGAQFAQIFGWERPRWYDKTRRRRDLFLQALQLVERGEGGGPGGARARGADGPLDLLEIRGDGQGRLCLPRAHLRQQDPDEGWRHHPRPSAERQWLHRVRNHGHAACGRIISMCSRPPWPSSTTSTS